MYFDEGLPLREIGVKLGFSRETIRHDIIADPRYEDMARENQRRHEIWSMPRIRGQVMDTYLQIGRRPRLGVDLPSGITSALTRHGVRYGELCEELGIPRGPHSVWTKAEVDEAIKRFYAEKGRAPNTTDYHASGIIDRALRREIMNEARRIGLPSLGSLRRFYSGADEAARANGFKPVLYVDRSSARTKAKTTRLRRGT